MLIAAAPPLTKPLPVDRRPSYEAQFAEESRVSTTAPLVEQMHFTPGVPLTATVAAAYTF